MPEIKFFFSLQSVLLYMTAFLTLIVFFWIWKKRRQPAAFYLGLFMLFCSLWSFTTGLEMATPLDSSLKPFLIKLNSSCFAFVPAFFFSFAQSFNNPQRNLKTFNYFLWGVPLLTLLILWGGGFHLVYKEFHPLDDKGCYAGCHFGIWYWIFIVYLLILFSAGTFLLLKKIKSCCRQQRQILHQLAFSFIYPLIAAILFFSGMDRVFKMDFTPLGFSITALIIGRLLTRIKIFDLVPIGHEQLLQTIPHPFLIIDHNFSIVDFNPAARKLFVGVEIGRDLFATCSELTNLRRIITYVPQISQEVALKRQPPIFVELKSITISFGLGNGWLLILYDITERNINEQKRLQLIAEIGRVHRKITDIEKILKICKRCGKILSRNDSWQKIETYITDQQRIISHACCPECAEKLKKTISNDEQE